MPATKSRANYPLSNEGQPQEPQFVRVVDGAGNDVQGSGSASQQVQGNVASAAADSGNPVKIAGKVDSVANTALTDGTRNDALLDSLGSLRITGARSGPYSAGLDGTYGSIAFIQTANSGSNVPPLAVVAGVTEGTDKWVRQRGDANGTVVQPALGSTFWQYAAAAGGIVSSTADVVLKAAGAAGVRNFLSGLSISHDTLSAATEFVIKDGATIIYRGKLQTAAVDGSAGAGTIKFDPPLRGTAATALNFALLTSVTGGVFVNAQGYTGA